MYEAKHQKVIPPKLFLKRLLRNSIIGFATILVSLGVGMSGYSYFENMSLVDAYVNATMILSGMGPLTPLNTVGGKIFAGFYALFSGLLFIIVIGIAVAPVIHRFFHKMHLDLFDD